jgi:hypothetical protein
MPSGSALSNRGWRIASGISVQWPLTDLRKCQTRLPPRLNSSYTAPQHHAPTAMRSQVKTTARYATVLELSHCQSRAGRHCVPQSRGAIEGRSYLCYRQGVFLCVPLGGASGKQSVSFTGPDKTSEEIILQSQGSQQGTKRLPGP